jgi:hypothetical protein
MAHTLYAFHKFLRVSKFKKKLENSADFFTDYYPLIGHNAGPANWT